MDCCHQRPATPQTRQHPALISFSYHPRIRERDSSGGDGGYTRDVKYFYTVAVRGRLFCCVFDIAESLIVLLLHDLVSLFLC